MYNYISSKASNGIFTPILSSMSQCIELLEVFDIVVLTESFSFQQVSFILRVSSQSLDYLFDSRFLLCRELFKEPAIPQGFRIQRIQPHLIFGIQILLQGCTFTRTTKKKITYQHILPRVINDLQENCFYMHIVQDNKKTEY